MKTITRVHYRLYTQGVPGNAHSGLSDVRQQIAFDLEAGYATLTDYEVRKERTTYYKGQVQSIQQLGVVPTPKP